MNEPHPGAQDDDPQVAPARRETTRRTAPRDAGHAARDGGLWRGVPKAERVLERRAKLLEAGLEVFGTVGVSEATVNLVCGSAQLTQRYFYESFPNLQELLAEVFVTNTDRQHAQMSAAALAVSARNGDLLEAARAALTVFYGSLYDDPRLARVQLLEILGVSKRIDTCYQDAIRRAADLVLTVSSVRETSRPAVPRLLALGLIGAVIEIATMWVLSGFADPVEIVVGSALVLFDAVLSKQLRAYPGRLERPGSPDAVPLQALPIARARESGAAHPAGPGAGSSIAAPD